jgi:hypothetical protein
MELIDCLDRGNKLIKSVTDGYEEQIMSNGF